MKRCPFCGTSHTKQELVDLTPIVDCVAVPLREAKQFDVESAIGCISDEDFVEQVRKSGLLQEDAMKSALREVSHTGTDGRSLARRFVESGLLTGWQCSRLLHGQHKGFFVGRYKILSHVGDGTVSSAYLAQNVALFNSVVLKVFAPKYLEADTVSAWWSARARAIAEQIDIRLPRVTDRIRDGDV